MRDGSKLPYWPAMMLRKTAAAYLDMPEAAFEREVISGRLPMPILFGGKERWSREQINVYLSNLTDGDDWRATSNLYAGSNGSGNWRSKSPVYNPELAEPEQARRKK